LQVVPVVARVASLVVVIFCMRGEIASERGPFNELTARANQKFAVSPVKRRAGFRSPNGV
jgi:hypothetical protein